VKVDECIVLDGKGSAAYLDRTQIINAAIKASCDAIHPGYGFLSENCNFAQQCLDNNIVFIGPTVEQLRILGDKTLAKRLAESCGVPTIKGTSENITLEEAEMFYKSLSPSEHAVIKATYGGGGRGMKIISSIDTLSEDMKHCASEAKAAFGDGSVYIEQLIRNARHIEIQIIGDGNGNVYSLGERECTIQRKYQKIIEYAPSPSIDESMRQTLINASIVMAKKLNYKSLGTFEFLIDMEDPGKYYFIEVNPRLQVEHTVTESVMGIDLVAAQLQLAKNVPLSTLMKDCNTRPNGYCIQTRINMEYLSEEDPDKFTPSGGSTIEVFEPPSGLGIRIDSIGYSGYTTSTNYDSLLAKLIVHSKSPNFLDCQKKAFRALSQFRIEGIKTNIPFLLALLNSPDFRENNSAMHTRYVDNNLRLLASHSYSKQYISSKLSNSSDMKYKMNECNEMGVKNVLAPMQGTILELNIAPGDMVQIGQQLAVMEAMKMQHVISANTNGKVQTIRCSIGDSVLAGSSVLDILESEINDTCTTSMSEGNNYQINLDFQRHDLQEVISRHDCGLDSSRAAAVKKRKSTGSRTARENLSSLYDEGSFVEYGALTIAAQRMRRSMSDLIQNTPADGLVCGIGSVNGSLFPSSNTQCILLSYDYMVLAGTQGVQNHRKKDRMFEIAESMKLPIIILAEGGGSKLIIIIILYEIIFCMFC
jgi:acetyl/propionyl-CoA carboxylase alpha subunit